jgi:hypothetical protein
VASQFLKRPPQSVSPIINDSSVLDTVHRVRYLHRTLTASLTLPPFRNGSPLWSVLLLDRHTRLTCSGLDEIVQLIFDELHDPGQLVLVSKRFHQFSQDSYVRAHYFLNHYGRIQAMYWALGRGKVINEKVLDVREACTPVAVMSM